MTIRFPFVASSTDTLDGAMGQASPNSVDSVRVALGRRSPILIMGGLFAGVCAETQGTTRWPRATTLLQSHAAHAKPAVIHGCPAKLPRLAGHRGDGPHPRGRVA